MMTSAEIVEVPEAGKFRMYFPQILASTVKNLLLLCTGLSVAFPTIVIPALKGLNVENNPNEVLTLTAIQSSWLGSILYICQPMGSLLSGWICEPFGRKRAMIVVNIPHIVSWLLLYYSTELWHIFLAFILFGFGDGLMEAPIITYIGEISQPSIRGILTAMSSMAATLGLFIVYSLGNIMSWRDAASYCLFVPLLTMIAVCFIPETPLWLLSKKRNGEALKSLQWLRGWVSPKAVEKEFKSLEHYNEYSNACAACVKAQKKCIHPPPNYVQKLKELLRKRTIKPFIVIMFGFFVAQFSGKFAMRPYIVEVMKAYGTPIDPNEATVYLGAAGIVATIISVFMVKIIGKRKLFLIALTVECAVCFSLAFYGFKYLPPGFLRSFDHDNYPYKLVNNNTYVPFCLFIVMFLCTGAGLSNVPWMLLSEMFPFKARGLATGLCAAGNYLIVFATTKTFYNIEDMLSLPGAAAFYGSICVIGFIVMYMILPETENRTLEDIEIHFSDNKLKLTDRKIPKLNKINVESGSDTDDCKQNEANGFTLVYNNTEKDMPNGVKHASGSYNGGYSDER